LPTDPNSLNYNGIRPISGRTVLLFIAVLAGLVAVAAPLLIGHGPLLAIGALYAVALLAAAIAVLPMGRAALPALALRAAPWKPVVLGPLATLALSVTVSQIGPEVESMKQVSDLVRGPGALLASLLALAVLAPIVEEIIFRGLLYGWIEGRWGWKAALPVSAIAFALAHFDPTYMILVLPLGVLFSWLRWRTGSLLPSIVAHMVNNGFAVLSAYWLG
jgi:membrane protease YdiL (CAAX protease family)